MPALFSFLCSACLLPQRILTRVLRSMAHEFSSLFLTSTQSSSLEHTATQTDDTRRLYMRAANEARRQALRTRRHFDMHGPPDWVDPALSILPHIGLLQEDSYCRGFIPSPCPFLAPHILISEPLVPDVYPDIAWTSILECQDQDYGDRLVVAEAPSLGSPRPRVFNPAPQATMEADEVPGRTCWGSPASNIPGLECDSASDGESGSEFSECPTGEDTAFVPTFWIDEDLPGLPADW
ncbi:hypothetical protein JB92DRAFT_3092404 [Gautieria morchelliformis]|nr:hypothetical protein JB92DRAFT_3092404 [Gautieria morchelliformis]